MTNSKFRIRGSLHPADAAWAAVFLSIIMSLSYGCSKEPAQFKSEKARQPEASQLPETANDLNNTAGESAGDSQVLNRIEPQPMVISGGTRLTVRLLETLSSKTASPGQSFAAELAAPVVVNGQTVLPSRTPLRGRVVSARSSGRLKNPGYLSLTLDSIRTPDGRWVGIDTSRVSAKGKSHKKRNIALIGGGSGVGAVIGAIAGGGKGAAIGAAAGAGAGTAGAYATGKKDVTFPAERKLSFSTVREISIG